MEGNEGDNFVVFFRIKFLKVPSDCSLGDPFGTRSSCYCANEMMIAYIGVKSARMQKFLLV